MQWEQLTADEFRVAARETGVCVIALGVLEKHATHLPLGTDYLNAHRIACLAAEKEPAVVFPPFYFGQIYEALCFPGAVALKPTLLVELLQSVFDEIGRNGFAKIVVVYGVMINMTDYCDKCDNEFYFHQDGSYEVIS